MNSYELSREFWNFSFENPEKVKPIHAAIYFFSIEHCNRLGWKEKFGLPSQMVMEAIGVKNWKTYSQGLNELIEFGFIVLLEKSTNQYSSNIIAIVNFTKAHTKAESKALDKALSKHSTKHSQSIVSIDKQYNNITIEQTNNLKEDFDFKKLKSTEWANQFCKAKNLQIEKFNTIFDNFLTDVLLKGQHLDYKDPEKEFKNHFINWFKRNPPQTTQPTYKRNPVIQ